MNSSLQPAKSWPVRLSLGSQTLAFIDLMSASELLDSKQSS